VWWTVNDRHRRRNLRSFQVRRQEWGLWAVPPVESRGKAHLGRSGGKALRSSPEADDTFSKMWYFEPVLWSMHDCTNQFNTKWKKNQFGNRKVVGQATMIAKIWAQKGRLSSLSSRLCRQWWPLSDNFAAEYYDGSILFFPARRCASAVYTETRCLSVCLSVTGRCSVEMAEAIELVLARECRCLQKYGYFPLEP